eukprot:1317206-Amorphochlora_amoeboformis.AAC.1
MVCACDSVWIDGRFCLIVDGGSLVRRFRQESETVTTIEPQNVPAARFLANGKDTSPTSPLALPEDRIPRRHLAQARGA